MRHGSRKKLKRTRQNTRRVKKGGGNPTPTKDAFSKLHTEIQKRRGYQTVGMMLLALAVVGGTAAIGFISLKGVIN